MSSAPSPIARILLAGLVDVIPEYTILEPYRDRNLNIWRSNGSYSIHQSDKQSFTLQVTQRDYGAVLFAESQILLNQAAEHRAHISNLLNTKNEPSPSWLFVTLYYFSLFVAMAWSRASNAAILYLDQDAIIEFCPGITVKPGGGAFEAIASMDPTTGISYVKFKKCRTSHFHEAAWIAVHKQVQKLFQEITNQTSGRKPSPEEIIALRALRLFDGLSFDNPQTWPSQLRNGINYRPGFSYRSVVKNNFLRLAPRLAKCHLKNLDEVISFGERAKSNIHGFNHPCEVANHSADLLVAQTIILEAFVEETFSQLCLLHDLRCSAASARKSFIKHNAMTPSIINSLI